VSPHDEISPERHRQRLDAPAYVRQRIDDLCGTLIGAVAKRAPFGRPHRTRARDHADIKQTQRYLNITDEELRKARTGVWERPPPAPGGQPVGGP
jgi:hypothetical protein